MRKVPLTRPYFPAEIEARILEGMRDIMRSGRLMNGPFTERFESAFAARVGVPHAVSVSSCTTAMQISLQHRDVAGREVLVPAGAFVTDASVAQFAGAKAVLVDIDPRTLALDVADLRRRIGPRTAAIIWVHLTGIISDEYAAIRGVAADNGLLLIEDAAHAHGAEIDGKQAGSLGDVGCFSFFPTKVLTTGTGGMLMTRDADLARYAREVRLLGRDTVTGRTVRIGNDWFMDEFRACVGYHQMSILDEILRLRRAVARRYDQALAGLRQVRLVPVAAGMKPAYYQYAINLLPPVDVKALIRALKDGHGIEAKHIYPPLHEEEIFRDLDDGTLGRTGEILHSSLCLPMAAGMGDEDIDAVVTALKAELEKVA